MLTVKRSAFAASVLAILFISCKKEEKTDDTNRFTILEVTTNTPIAGARVDAYKCLERDLLGCFREAVSTSATTNSEGIATISGATEISSITAHKEKYWEASEYFSRNQQPVTATTYLYPIATLKIHVVKENQYPATNQLMLHSPIEPCRDCPREAIVLGLPQDTTVYMKGRGNVNNSIQWVVNTGSADMLTTTTPVMVNRFDTAQIEIRY